MPAAVTREQSPPRTRVTGPDRAAWPAAAARSRIYRQFAAALMHPDEGVGRDLGDGTWLCRLETEAPHLPYEFPFERPPAADDLTPGARADLNEVYTSQFEVGQGALSLYGRTYLGRDEKSLFEELFRFYEHFGLTFDGGLRAWPDWIVVELEFMHYLCFLEAEAAGNAIGNALRRAERDFLERHMSNFSAGLAATLSDRNVPGYAHVGRLLSVFVAADACYLQQCADATGGS